MLLLLACLTTPQGSLAESDADTDTDADTDADTDTDTDSDVSTGCGQATDLAAGGVQQGLDAGSAGDGERGYWLSLPEGYDPDTPHAVVVGYAGTDWVGYQIQPYLDLERRATEDTIFVYPDPLWRSFDGWGTYGGWVLGPHAYPADGMGDLVFTEALLDELEASFCVDPDRVFVTGHSWGGDMAAVATCFLGDRVTAGAPVAANSPYWFDAGGFSCEGEAAVWTFFGIDDDHFTWQGYPGEFGDQQNDFWLDEHGCGGASEDLGLDGSGTCLEYTDCATETRYCLYGPSSGHQVPSYFAPATMEWFESF